MSFVKVASYAVLAFGLAFTGARVEAFVPKPVTESQLAARLSGYAALRSLEVPFSQVKWMKDMDLRLKSEGRLQLRRPDEVIWEVMRPSHLKIVLGKGRVRIEQGSGKGATVQDYKLSELPGDPASKALAGMVAWMNLDAHALTDQYAVSLIDEDLYRFEPKVRDGAPFDRLEMRLRANGQLAHLTIFEASKDQIDIDFGNPVLK